jgi:K+:H+ antiporter
MIATATTGRVLLDVAVVLVAAWAGGLLFARIGQPAVIGEIAAGVALGPTLLGALPGDPSEALFPADALEVLKIVGQLGLAAFMFTIGWDLDLRLVRRQEGAAATVSIASIVLPFVLGLGLAAYLHPAHDTVAGSAVPFWPFALFIGTALSLTAFPVLARILTDTRMDSTPVGVLALTAAAIDDVIGWSVLAFALAVLASSSAWEYVRIVAECAAFVAIVLLVVRPVLQRLLRRPTPAREALVLPIAFAGAYVTEAIGIHAVFGAFLVGIAMPRPTAGDARRRLAPVVAVLAPVYFVTSGMGVDIPGLRAGDLAAFALILAAACAGKFVGAYAGARAGGMPARDSAAVGILMNTRGLIEIVLLTVGHDQGLIDDRLFTLFALMAIVTTLATTPVLRRLARSQLRLTPAGTAQSPAVGAAPSTRKQ